MARKRIIKDLNKTGQGNKYAVQIYDDKYGWDYLEYTDNINIMGNDIECPVHPVWYDNYDEAKSKIKEIDEILEEINIEDYETIL